MTDTERIQKILRAYREKAIERGSSSAQDDVEFLMKMFDKFYSAYYREVIGEKTS